MHAISLSEKPASRPGETSASLSTTPGSNRRRKPRDRIVQTVRHAFDPYVDGGQVRFDAACWTVAARAASGTAAGRGCPDALER